jgi:hypothetical protein
LGQRLRRWLVDEVLCFVAVVCVRLLGDVTLLCRLRLEPDDRVAVDSDRVVCGACRAEGASRRLLLEDFAAGVRDEVRVVGGCTCTGWRVVRGWLTRRSFELLVGRWIVTGCRVVRGWVTPRSEELAVDRWTCSGWRAARGWVTSCSLDWVVACERVVRLTAVRWDVAGLVRTVGRDRSTDFGVVRVTVRSLVAVRVVVTLRP